MFGWMGHHIGFKKYRLEDFVDYCNLVSDDRVMRYVTGKGMSEAEASATFDRFLKVNQMDHSLGYFKVFDSEREINIGECKLVHYAKDPSVFEIGYLLREPFWKQGYGTEVCARMLELATAVDPDKDIIGIIDPANTVSRRLLEKFGFISFFIGTEDRLPTEKLVLKRRKNNT